MVWNFQYEEDVWKVKESVFFVFWYFCGVMYDIFVDNDIVNTTFVQKNKILSKLTITDEEKEKILNINWKETDIKESTPLQKQ